jgi:MerR family transcriptional regulator, heat shock protein HspR
VNRLESGSAWRREEETVGGNERRRAAPDSDARSDERVRDDRTDDHAVYIISVAAELAGVHPQTLRIYERKGLLSPKRTAGNTRRYSDADIDRLRLIQELTQDMGVNLAGVKMIMELQREVEELERRAETLERALRASAADAPGVARGAEIVPLHTWVLFPWERETTT